MRGLERSFENIVRSGREPSNSFDFASCTLDPARKPYRACNRGANPVADLLRHAAGRTGAAMAKS